MGRKAVRLKALGTGATDEEIVVNAKNQTTSERKECRKSIATSSGS